MKLTYFNFDGSRGLECRLALTLAGVAFEDERVTGPTWQALKPDLPFGSLPVLTVGERRLSQSNAILVYVGRSHGLHPADLWTAAEHEALMLSVEDLREKIAVPADHSDADRRAAREAFAAGWLSRWAETVSARIAGPFLEGEALHVADIKLYVILRSFSAGVYEHIPAEVFAPWPALGALYEAVSAHPGVEGYFERGTS